jgi:hypothetical protein
MQAVSTVLVYLAFAGAIVSWIAGAVLYARALAAIGDDRAFKWLAIVAWPFAIGRIKGAAAEPASQVNKALVAFIACVLVGFAAFSASVNLQRFAR